MTRVPALDGIRGIAILLVLVGHGFSGFVGHTFGQDGVRLFFVLSGFLITQQLLEARSSGASRAEQLRVFYARRFFRLFPIYYLFLIVATLLNFGGARSFDALYLWTYTYNMTVATNDAVIVPGVGHLWSLCVEEQFYLVWPWLVVFTASKKKLWWATLAIVVSSLALRFWLLYDDHWRADYVLMPTNADALGIGALVAIRRPSIWISLTLTAVGLLLTQLTSGYWVFMDAPGSAAWPYLASETGKSLRNIGMIAAASGGALSWLGVSPLAWLGRISYCVYVVHWMLEPIVKQLSGRLLNPPEHGIWSFMFLSIGSIWIAMLSWRFIEAPIGQYYRRRFRYEHGEGRREARKSNLTSAATFPFLD